MNPLNINCKKCKKSFDRGEQMSLYNNNYYHNTCFKCNFCDASLAGRGFFTRPDGSFQCNECHEYHSPKCFVCEKSISDGVKYNVYQGKHFHKECFKCVKCKSIIQEGRSFVDSPHGLLCLDCSKVTNHGHPGRLAAKDTANFTQPAASSDPHPSGRDHECAKCMRLIPPNTIYGIYEGRQYHNDCFGCNRCGKNLVNTVCRRLGSAIVCKDCS